MTGSTGAGRPSAAQFPNVVSKLALLVTSGMIMDRAWRETAQSQDLELYQEMRITAEELSNLVDPTTAYTNFINRCNTKETTKLASAIIQSQSKGNAEIGALLKGMAHDAWQERRPYRQAGLRKGQLQADDPHDAAVCSHPGDDHGAGGAELCQPVRRKEEIP